jgi:hypothetical protein
MTWSGASRFAGYDVSLIAQPGRPAAIHFPLSYYSFSVTLPEFSRCGRESIDLS